MTVHEAHIFFDSLLREVNKEIQENIIPEQKDIFLNAAAALKIKETARQERDQIRNVVTYANINDYYSNLAPFIVELELPLTGENYRYNYADLPAPSKSLNSKNLYLNNTTYVIGSESSGFDVSNLTTDVTPDEGVYIGQIFDITIGNIRVPESQNEEGGDVETLPGKSVTDSTTAIKKGNIYKIVYTNLNLLDYGAVSNIPGTIFTATRDKDFKSVSGANLNLEVYAAKPNKLGSPTFQASPTNSRDYAEVLLISALVDVSNPIAKGGLTKGKLYRISKVGNTELSAFGFEGEQYINAVFQNTTTGSPEWSDNPTVLVEVDYKGTDMIKPVDLEMKLNHAFGTTISRPISVIVDNQVRLYHMGNFGVFRCNIIYIRVPNKINYKAGGELEFNEIEQIDLVQRAVNLAAASLSSSNYPPLSNEVSRKANTETRN
jgi:hypothetical protein